MFDAVFRRFGFDLLPQLASKVISVSQRSRRNFHHGAHVDLYLFREPRFGLTWCPIVSWPANVSYDLCPTLPHLAPAPPIPLPSHPPPKHNSPHVPNGPGPGYPRQKLFLNCWSRKNCSAAPLTPLRRLILTDIVALVRRGVVCGVGEDGEVVSRRLQFTEPR